MNVLEIFGICFIIEITIIMTCIVVLLITSFVDRIQKKQTYKEMIQLENRLSRQQKEKQNKAEKPIEDIIQEEKLEHNNPLLNKILEGAITGGYVPEDKKENTKTED